MFGIGEGENQEIETPEGVSRRGFLAQSAGLAAALTLGPRALAWLRAAGIGASVAPVLSGCSNLRSAEEMARKLIIAINMDVRTLDPAMSNMALDGTIICLIHENLTWFDEQFRLIPRLALSWETPDNARSWIFKLRPGVKFHDGTDFNAEAVKIHFDRIKNPLTESNRLNKLDDVDRIEVVDPLTVTFHMKRPYSVWPTVVRDAFSAICSPAAIAKAEALTAEANGTQPGETSGTVTQAKIAVPKTSPQFYRNFPTGTGPYMFVGYEPDQYIRLRKNPEHRDAAQYMFEELEFRPVREPTTRLVMLEQARLDIGSVMEAHVIPAEKGGHLRITSVPALRVAYIGLNYQKPPFSDQRVRQAVNYAVDRNDIVQHVFRGRAEPMMGPLPSWLPSYNRNLKPYAYDPEKARALLKEAGYPNGIDVTLWAMESIDHTNLAVLVSEQLRHVGIRLNVIRYDRAVYYEKFDPYLTNDGKKYPTREGVFDMFIAGWTGGETAHGYLYHLFRSTSSSNSSFYENPEVDRLLAQSLETADEAERDKIYGKLQEIILSDAPWIFVYHPHILLGVNPRLTNFAANAAGEWNLTGLEVAGEKKEVRQA